MAAASTIIAAAAVTSAAVGVGSALIGASRSAPSIPSPPAPASYYSYSDDGRVTEQVWDASRNAYVTRTKWESEEKKKEYEELQKKYKALREEALARIDQPTAERLEEIRKYGDTVAGSMQKYVDEAYEKTRTGTLEHLEKSGLTGSKAYVDALAKLQEEKLRADADVAEKATLAKESLLKSDRDYWLNVLGQIDAGARADTLAALQQYQMAQRATEAANANLLSTYGLLTNAQLQNWAARQQQLQNLSTTGMNTATGLAFLYGFTNNKGAFTTKNNPTSSSWNVRTYYNQWPVSLWR